MCNLNCCENVHFMSTEKKDAIIFNQMFATVKSHSCSYLCNDAYEQDKSNSKQGELWGRINELCSVS